MTATPRPVSLVAEKAVRYLREHPEPVDSVALAHEVLATRIADESSARRILESAFAGDPRLAYRDGGWRRNRASEVARPTLALPAPVIDPDPDCVFLALEGRRPARGRPWELCRVGAVRLEGGEVAAACGGDVAPGASGERLRRVLARTLRDAVPVVHDPPGSLAALQRWLDEPLRAVVSLRRLARKRFGLPARHDLETLLVRLGLTWRDSDDPLAIADALSACLEALRRPGESLDDLCRASAEGAPPIDWSRFEFDRSFLRGLPHVPGTYQFFDHAGRLLYAGKSNDLNRRINSYFREGAGRTGRVQRLLDELHRIDVEPSGSDLEAMLREARLIRQREPSRNTQRRVRPRPSRAARLRSILILEPAAGPLVLRAYLLRDGRLVDRVGIGPRGGGLKRIERVLDDHFFSLPTGPTPAAGPDVDVEVVARWLAANRGRVVAFDPTDLRSAREVTDRLRWFLGQGTPFDPDGAPIVSR